MSWNESGNNREDRDPWGNRQGGDQGPPDLDEAFRKFQRRLGELFGGGRFGGSGQRSINFSAGFFGLVCVALLIIYGIAGVYTVNEQERGVVLRFGKALEQIVMPGLHWNPPLIDRVMIENVTRVRSHVHSAEMLTEDENIVRVTMSVQYNIKDSVAFLLRVKSPEVSLQHATESALRHVVGSSSMDSVLTEGRVALAQDVQERIQQYMDAYETGIDVSQVNVDDTSPPEAVKASFDDVIRAREDEVRLRNEADAYANGIVPEARGEAQRQLELANAYRARVAAEAKGEASRFEQLLTQYELAPEVTRERLYLDAMESIMSNSTKVMIDVEGGNNLLYLPLDRLVERQVEQDSMAPAREARNRGEQVANPNRRSRERS